MTSLRKRNCAQEEGRDWARGRNTRWLPGTGDRQLAGPRGWFSGLPEGQRLTRDSQDAGVPVYRRARLARPRELRRAPPARAPEHREPTPPSDSEFPSLCCVFPPAPAHGAREMGGTWAGPAPLPALIG